jgi:hypothetical protein
MMTGFICFSKKIFYEQQIKLTTMVKLEDGRLFVKIGFIR